eukprot:scaffold9715_cov113-Isochrysis_galbana.AAC.5
MPSSEPSFRAPTARRLPPPPPPPAPRFLPVEAPPLLPPLPWIVATCDRPPGLADADDPAFALGGLDPLPLAGATAWPDSLSACTMSVSPLCSTPAIGASSARSSADGGKPWLHRRVSSATPPACATSALRAPNVHSAGQRRLSILLAKRTRRQISVMSSDSVDSVGARPFLL